MTFDTERAERSLVEILDGLNGDRVVGLGVLLPGGAIATSCQCLPRPCGRALYPDPEAPSLPLLVRVRRPGADQATNAVVAGAGAFSRLVLLRSPAAAGQEVPEELNPGLTVEALLGALTPARLGAAPPGGTPARLRTPAGRWLAGTVAGGAFTAAEAGELDGAWGAPAFAEDGRLLGVLALADGVEREAPLCLLAEHLPGWVLRRAGEAEAEHEAAAGAA
jgi:hypothetical protein